MKYANKLQSYAEFHHSCCYFCNILKQRVGLKVCGHEMWVRNVGRHTFSHNFGVHALTWRLCWLCRSGDWRSERDFVSIYWTQGALSSDWLGQPPLTCPWPIRGECAVCVCVFVFAYQWTDDVCVCFCVFTFLLGVHCYELSVWAWLTVFLLEVFPLTVLQCSGVFPQRVSAPYIWLWKRCSSWTAELLKLSVLLNVLPASD